MAPICDPPAPLTNHPALNLLRDPFAPELPPPPAVGRFQFCGSGPLDPLSDMRHLGLYLDLYDWRDPDRVKGLAENGRLVTLQRANVDRAMLLLVSGFAGCGRTSMVNLLLYEIGQRIVGTPLVVKYPTKITAKSAQHAIDIAQLLARAVSRMPNQAALVQTIRDTLKDWLGAVLPGEQPNPETLFDLLRADIPQDFRVIVVLDAVDHTISNDIWRPICRMLDRFADFLVVCLAKKDEADLISVYLEDGASRVGRIDAPYVTRDRLATLLARRLASERAIANTDKASLAPFTPEALDVLFRRSGASGKAVEWSITVTMKHLAAVFAAKSQALAAMVAAGHAPGPNDIAITAQDMESYLATR